MEKQKEGEEDQTIEKIQERVKKVLFKVNNHLLKHMESFNEYIFFILIFIETIQILWFSIHPTFVFISYSIGMKELQLGIRYFSIQYYLRENPGSWELCMIIAFVITIFHIVSLAITSWFLYQDTVSETGELLAKISNIQILIMNTVLTGPFFNIVATTLYCDTNSPYHLGENCYSGSGIAYCVLACIVGLVLIIQGALYAFIYYIKNPFSRGCLSSPSNIYYIGKFWLKTLPALYFLIDPQLFYKHVYIFAYVIVFAGYIFLFRMFSAHTYNERYYYYTYNCEIALTWLGLVNILQYYMSQPDRPNLCLIFSLFGILPLAYTFMKLQKQSKKKIFLEGIRNLKKNKEVAEEFIYMIISLIETISIHKNKIQLMGFMKIHNGGCEEENKCNCHSFLQAFYQKKKFTPEEELHIFHEFLKNLLFDYIKKYSGLTIFKIIYAYLLYYKLESKIQGIHYITEAGKEKVSFAEEFLIYRLKLLFKEESRQKQNDLAQDKSHAVKVYLEFNRLFLELENQIQTCAKNNLEYWRQLTEDFPSVLKLWNLAKHFQMQTKNAEKLFNQITEIYPNNIMTLLLYSNFLKSIVLDHKEYTKLHEKIKSEKFSAQSSAKEMNDMKFRENSNLCIITIATHVNNMGVILNSNSELQRTLGYYKSEVVGQKVTKIMPKPYYDLHDGFILKYINRPDKEIQSKEFTVFALCKKGFLVECNMLTKLIPEIQNGFHLVGFLKKVEETSRYVPHYIMYDGDSNYIEAISETCVESLGLTSDSIVKGGNTSQITVNYLFPQIDFEELDNRPELKIEGFQTIIDTRVISDDFVPFESYEENSEVDDKNSRRMNAKVYLLKQSVYGKLKLKFIKFFLLSEEEQHNEATKQQIQAQQQLKQEQSETEEYRYIDDNDDREAGYHKKYTEFVSQGSTKCLLILLVIGVYVFMAMEASLVSFDVAENIIDSNEVTYAMGVLNESNAILICLNNANFDTRKLHLTNPLNLTVDQYQRYQDHMNDSIFYMQATLVEFIRTLVVLQDNYKYDQDKLYDTYSFYNNLGAPITQLFQYNDALFEYITTVISVSNTPLDSFNQTNITNTTLLSNLYFIETNGMTTINERTTTNIINLTTFFTERFNIYLRNRQILLALRIVSVMIIFFLILPIIIMLDKINHKLLGIYRLIPLDDIRIIEENSEKFLNKNFEDSYTSKLKEVQTHGLDNNLSAISNNPSGLLDEKKESLLPVESAMSSRRESSRSNLLSPSSTLRPAQTSDALLMTSMTSYDQQRASLKRNSLVMDAVDEIQSRKKVPKVKLSQIPSSKNQIIFLTLVIAFLLGYCVGEYYLHHYFFEPFQDYEETLRLYKLVSSSTRQSLQYAQEYAATGDGLDSFNDVAASLYVNIDILYDLTTDANKNRETIYGSIQELKSLLTAATVQMMTQSKFRRIESSLDAVQINLNDEANAFIEKSKNEIAGTFQKTCYIKFMVELIVVAVLIKVLFSGYLEKVKIRTHRSTSMALMIPIAIITKNPQILALL